MRRNCNLKLQLQPSSLPQHFGNGHHHHLHLRQRQPMVVEDSSDQQQQMMTIFYNGQVCVCDVTEFQARAIIMLASREMTGKSPTSGGDHTSTTALRDHQDEEDDLGLSPQNHHRTTSLSAHSQVPSPSPTPAATLSMKRSLQRFLQKRRHRIMATSPYNVQ